VPDNGDKLSLWGKSQGIFELFSAQDFSFDKILFAVKALSSFHNK
jgi:hypothetical protein